MSEKIYQSEKYYDVIGLGSSMLDFLQVVDHFPDTEEVQKAIASAIEGGGPVATAIVTLARLGACAAMIDSLGNDWLGDFIIKEFEKERVDTSLLKIHKGETSSLSNILVKKTDGARTIVYSRGSAPEINPADISIDKINQTKFVHISGRHFDACLHAARVCKENNTKVSFDGGSHRYKDRDKQLLPLVDVCIVAKDYAFSYSNQEEIISAGTMLLNEGPGIVVITNGVNGSWLFSKEIKPYHQKAFVLEDTVDTTGCGDSFHGAFLFGLCKEFDLYETIKFASAVAALNSLKLGGRYGLPTLEKVEEFLRRHK